MKRRRIIVTTFQLLAIVVLVLVAVFPLYWMFNIALMPTSVMFQEAPRFIPDLTRFANFFDAFTAMRLGKWLSNSLVIAIGTAVLGVLLALFGAYALSRFRFRGRGAFGFAMIATQMLPEALLLVPLYSMFLALGLLNGLAGLVLVDVAFVTPILVWLLKSAIDSVPIELEEAAMIDGCSSLKIQMRIVWPLISPSIAACAVLAFFAAWNEFLVANTFILDEDKRVASVGLASLIGELTTPMDQVMSAAVLYALPALVFFLIVQRHIVSGLTAGSVKG